MSTIFDNKQSQDTFNTYIDVEEYAIGGKLVSVSTLVSLEKMQEALNHDDFKTHLKSTMLNQLSDYMLSNKLVEFTQQYLPDSHTTKVTARCYLVPDSQVKLLRTLKK